MGSLKDKEVSMGVYGNLRIFFSLTFVKKKEDEGIHHPDLERDACSLFLLGPRWQEGRIFEYHRKFSTLFGGNCPSTRQRG